MKMGKLIIRYYRGEWNVLNIVDGYGLDFSKEPNDKWVNSKYLTLYETPNLAPTTHLFEAAEHILCIFWEASEDNGGTSGGGS